MNKTFAWAASIALCGWAIACSSSTNPSSSSTSTGSGSGSSGASGTASGSFAKLCSYQINNSCGITAELGGSVSSCETTVSKLTAPPSACLTCLESSCYASCVNECTSFSVGVAGGSSGVTVTSAGSSGSAIMTTSATSVSGGGDTCASACAHQYGPSACGAADAGLGSSESVCVSECTANGAPAACLSCLSTSCYSDCGSQCGSTSTVVDAG